MGVSFALPLARVEERLAQAQQPLSVLAAKGQDPHVPQRLIAHLSAEAAQLRTAQAAYPGVRRHASQAVHPFRLADSGRQTSAQVEAALQEAVASLNTLRARYTARDNQRPVAKVTR
jgi:hypothetical protein